MAKRFPRTRYVLANIVHGSSFGINLRSLITDTTQSSQNSSNYTNASDNTSSILSLSCFGYIWASGFILTLCYAISSPVSAFLSARSLCVRVSFLPALMVDLNHRLCSCCWCVSSFGCFIWRGRDGDRMRILYGVIAIGVAY